jgi:hypothetical protein
MIDPSRILLSDLAAEYKGVHIPFDFAGEALVIFKGRAALRSAKGASAVLGAVAVAAEHAAQGRDREVSANGAGGVKPSSLASLSTLARTWRNRSVRLAAVASIAS